MGIYIRSEPIIKLITIKRKLVFVFSNIIKEITSQIMSFEIFITKNFIPSSGFLYKNFLKTKNTAKLKTASKKIMVKKIIL